MTYTLAKIIRDTRIMLDLNICERPLIAPDRYENLDIDSMIRAVLIPAALEVMEESDDMLLTPGKPIRALLAWQEGTPGMGMAILPLPDDCLKLIAVKLTDWCRQAQIKKETDAEHAWQSSPFPGVRGNPDRPMAFICQRPTGLVAELYSSNTTNGVGIEYAQYVPKPHVEAADTIRLPDAIYHDVIVRTAKKVADIIGDARQ